MNIIAWLLLGLLAGAIARAIYPGYQGGGILGTILLGITGAFIGSSLYSLLTTGTVNLAATGLSISGLVIAIVGALIITLLWSLMTRRTTI
jgi:uncharacterized membrane protein YeaQ/YmgE (transglycosylase-associated protein family)